MQISKRFQVLCAVAFCTALLALHAADIDTEVKLRAALHQKMAELYGPKPAPPLPDSEAVAKLRVALRQKMAELPCGAPHE